jgi:outer membrane protein TolC
VLAAWWRQFDDPVLDGLVADALAANLDLATAQA